MTDARWDTAPPAADDPDPRRWKALAVCLLALFMTLLDLSLVNVALPSIGHSIGAGPAALQWVVSGYTLAFGLVPVLAGRLGDDRGRRPMFLLGVVGFTVASALVGLSPSPGLLVAARLLQGLCGGLINPQVAGIVQQLFRGAERARAFGALGGTVGVATATGPVLGGLLIGLGGPTYGWRLAFFVNLPIGVAVVVLARRLLPPPPIVSRHSRLDLVGAALLGLTTAGILIPAVEYDADHDLRLALIAVPALGCFVAFLAWERRAAAPLVDLALFRARSYAVGVSLALLYFCGYAGVALVLSLFFQQGLGYSALEAGLALTGFALGSAVSSAVAGRLLPRLGRLVVVLALLLFVVGIAAVSVVVHLAAGSRPGAVGLLLVAPLVVAGLGSGAVISPNQALSLEDIDPRGGSTAAAVLQTAQRMGAAVGAAVIGAVFFAGVGPPGAAGPDRTGSYGQALDAALVVTLAFAGAALALSVVDYVGSRRRRVS